MTKLTRPAPKTKPTKTMGAQLLEAYAAEQSSVFDITLMRNVKEVAWEHTPECETKGCIQAAAYCRQSKGELESLEAQESSIDRWKAKAEQDLRMESGTDKVIHIAYIVWDKTGAWTDNGPKPKRPGMDAINALVNARRVELLLAREVSRYDRVVEDALNFLRNCRENGVRVITHMDGVQGDCADNKKYHTVVLVLLKLANNSEESRKTGQRIDENTVELRECGFWLGGMQTGYFPKGGEYRDNVDERGNMTRELFAPRHPRTHSNGRVIYGKILEAQDGWKEAVAKASSIIITGGTFKAAGQVFVDAGFDCRTKHGEIESQRVRLWLTSPILIGYLSHDTEGELRKNRANNGLRRLQYVQTDAAGNMIAGVDPVMTWDRWLELQHAIQSRMDMRAPSTPFLLQGVLICEKCGYRMTRAKSIRGYNNYVCLNTKRGTCTGVSISMERIDDYMTAELLKRFDPAEIENSRLAYEEEMDRLKAAMPTGHAEELADLNAKLNLITDMILEETSPAGRENLKKKRDDITKKIDELQTFQAMTPAAPSVGVILDGANIDGYALADLWPNLPIEQQNAIIRSACEGVQIKMVQRSQTEGNGRFRFDASRVVIWWRGTAKPAAWDQKHESNLEVSV